jgi:SAM-dependent methyltransferase
MQLSYNQLTRWRKECNQRFGNIHDVSIRGPQAELQTLLQPNSRVLDVGAGVDKPLRNTIREPEQRYYSLDNDPDGSFDFASFDDVPLDMKFDVMVANQVLEHLTIDEAYGMLCTAYRHLSEGGHFLATVPSPSHPVRQWDPTHLTPWPMNDLYGLFRASGFQVSTLCRYNKYPLTRNPFKRLVVNIVCEAFRVDWCDSLMIVGTRAA